MQSKDPPASDADATFLGTRQRRALSGESIFSFTTASSGSSGSSGASGTSYGSSHSTIWGPGALAGKGIKKIGVTTLRGVENFVIQRRLQAVEAFFPVKTFEDDHKVEEMCDDVLELSRVSFYNDKIRERALRAIIVQISYGNMKYLLRSIQKWPLGEVELFATSFMVAPFSRSSSDSVAHTLLESPLVETGKKAAKVFLFICELARNNPLLFPLLAKLGFLNIMLRFAISPFHPEYGYENLFEVCNDTLRTVCTSGFEEASPEGSMPAYQMQLRERRASEQNREIIIQHPLFHLWPSRASLFLREPAASGRRVSYQARHAKGPRWDRQAAWRRLRRSDVEWRILAMQPLWESAGSGDDSEPSFNSALDACVDLFSVIGYRHPVSVSADQGTPSPTTHSFLIAPLSSSPPSVHADLPDDVDGDLITLNARKLLRALVASSPEFRRAYHWCYIDAERCCERAGVSMSVLIAMHTDIVRACALGAFERCPACGEILGTCQWRCPMLDSDPRGGSRDGGRLRTDSGNPPVSMMRAEIGTVEENEDDEWFDAHSALTIDD